MNSGSYQIFTRAGFSRDQNRHVHLGCLHDLLKNHAHRHAHGDHAIEFDGQNFDGWRGLFAVKRGGRFDRRFDNQFELPLIIRSSQPQIPAAPIHYVLRRAYVRDENDRCLLRVFGEFSQTSGDFSGRF